MIALALLLVTAVPQQAEAEPGVFEHGPWKGQCYRDGYMHGAAQEMCRGVMTGPVEISFERTAAGMQVSIAAPNCPGMTLNMDPPPATQAPAKRAAAIGGMLTFMIQDMLKSCHSKLRAPKIDAESLGAVLVATDGLAR